LIDQSIIDYLNEARVSVCQCRMLLSCVCSPQLVNAEDEERKSTRQSVAVSVSEKKRHFLVCAQKTRQLWFKSY